MGGGRGRRNERSWLTRKPQKPQKNQLLYSLEIVVSNTYWNFEKRISGLTAREGEKRGAGKGPTKKEEVGKKEPRICTRASFGSRKTDAWTGEKKNGAFQYGVETNCAARRSGGRLQGSARGRLGQKVKQQVIREMLQEEEIGLRTFREI